MKKTVALILITVMTLCCFSACAGVGNTVADDGKLKIVCTIFPLYDWVKTILGDDTENAELTLLLDSGTDLHSFQPTADDILTVTGCDLFVYVGGESDGWVDDVFNTVKSGTVKLNMMETLGEAVVEEETVEGMEAEAEEEEEEEHGISETEYDEHVWLSLKNAGTLCEAIKDALVKLDPSNTNTYTANCGNYRQDLAVLDSEYTEAVSSAARKVVLFADRFPFRYLVNDYGLDYHAAFSGCSAETEASFETIKYLSDKTDELDLPVILVTETADKTIAETVRSTTGNKDQEILVMNALQSVTADKLSDGVTYLDTMKSNLEVMKQALN